MKAAHSTPRDGQAGGALIVALITMVVCVTLAFSALNVATRHQGDVHRAGAEVQARAAAEAGVQHAICFLEETMAKDPWDPARPLDTVLLADGSGNYRLASEEPVLHDGRRHGTFSVHLQTAVDGDARTVVITSSGYFPQRSHAEARSTVQTIVRLSRERSPLFDDAYFVNNWAWFYGDTMAAHGNVRVNGQFDASGYEAAIHGSPRYAGRDGHSLLGYRDDNGDGVRDGSDGGIYAGWGIANVDRVTGLGGLEENQHAHGSHTAMPNLARLDEYEQRALGHGSGIELGGQTDELGNPAPNLPLCDAIQGDGVGEVENLVLIGTEEQPLVLDGPVVVRGDVIIKGVVSGQGAIYAGGNVYVADDLVYLDGPDSPRPASNSQADTEAWIAANAGKDYLGLFARGHVVLGDHEDESWRYPVSWWLDHPMNDSSEDTGADHIPKTAEGRDGIAGTEDDDLLEGDGEWTTAVYDERDQELGLIPAGYAVGDPIPGTGEDIDGDGKRDDGVTMADLDLKNSLSSGCWAGNLPEGTQCYCELASLTMTQVQASLYTPGTLAMVTVAENDRLQFFGSVACRNESVLYGTPGLDFIHDSRLLGGGPLQSLLPSAPMTSRVLGWRVVENGDVEQEVPIF